MQEASSINEKCSLLKEECTFFFFLLQSKRTSFSISIQEASAHKPLTVHPCTCLMSEPVTPQRNLATATFTDKEHSRIYLCEQTPTSVIVDRDKQSSPG